MSLQRIITVGKDPEVQRLAQRYCREVFVSDNLDEVFDTIKRSSPNMILFDHHFSADNIHKFISRANNSSINIPVVVVGDGDNGRRELFDTIKETGTFEYLHDKDDFEQLQEIISRIQNVKENDCGAGTLFEQQGSRQFFADDLAYSVRMAGKSPAMLNALKMIRLVAESRCNPVLVIGETGTGKELAAKAIHTLRNPGQQFVAINCAALTANLLESELFGHVKGSFTGADREKQGLLELAGNGTVLLDEISEMPLELQAKLLRVIEERTFRKVGGTQSISCGATIIAASNRNLLNEVNKNQFRRDIYYRLNICPVTLSALRAAERRPDIPLLADYFLRTSTICPDKLNKITGITRLAVEALQRYDWPGNVRELRNIIDRAILLETTDKIGLSGIIFDPCEKTELSQGALNSGIKDYSLEKAERGLIWRALQDTGWQKTRAATLLGITRATLYAKVKQYNIEKDSSSDSDACEPEQEELVYASNQD